MTQIDIKLRPPMAHQLALLASPARFKVASCGRRWGKTIAGLIACIVGHGPPDRHLRGALDGGKIWWVTKTHEVALEVWEYVKYTLMPVVAEKSEQFRDMKLVTGGRLSVKSAADSDSLRGSGLDGVVLDEWAHWHRGGYAWKSVLRPTLSVARGWAIFISTPTPKGAWFRELFNAAESDPECERWQHPTSDNPRVHPAEIERARIDLGETLFSQEYGAQFLDQIGGMFRRDAAAILSAPPSNIVARVRAWDLAATTGGARTAGVSLCRTSAHAYAVLDSVCGRWTPDARDSRILATAEADGKGVPIIIEQEGGSAGVDQRLALARLLAGYRVDFTRPTGDKATRAGPFASQWNSGNVSLVAGPWNGEYLDELSLFPDGPLKDQVDASAHGFNAIAARRPATAPPPPARRRQEIDDVLPRVNARRELDSIFRGAIDTGEGE